MNRSPTPSLNQRLAAEALGTALLLAAVVGSGIMAERLAAGNGAVALLCNAIATGAALIVLITMLAPISGAHFNPAVTLISWLDGQTTTRDTGGYVGAQVVGGLIGVVAAHAMFDLDLVQQSQHVRTGAAQWTAEAIAAFGLLLTILLTSRAKPDFVPVAVGLYITSAYWFTASTSFANPAVSLARAFTDTFAGIRLADVPAFAAAQIVGALIGWQVARALTAERK